MKQCEPFPLRSEIVIDNYYRNIVIGISAEPLSSRTSITLEIPSIPSFSINRNLAAYLVTFSADDIFTDGSENLEGLVPNAPNALISIRYRLANYLCNEYVTNNFHHFQRFSCRHPDRLVSLCEVTKIYVRLQVRGFDLENNNTEC